MLLTVLTLAGCASVGPDYRQPVLPVPVAWQANLPHDGEQATLVDWWAQFNDPILTQLISEAEASSPTLLIAAGRIDEARAALTSRQAAGLPAVNGAASVTQSGTQGDGAISSRTTGVVAVDAAWEIDLFGRVRRSTEAAESRLAARRFDWHDARVTLSAEVANTYTAYRGCRQLEATYARDVASRSETTRLTGLSVSVGFTAPADGRLAEAGLADARADQESQRAACEILIKSLVALVGIDEPELRAQLGNTGVEPAALPVPATFAVEQIPLRVLSQRPDLAAVERDLAAATADVGVAEANRYPRLSLLGNISLAGVLTGGGSLVSVPWSLGPALTAPLFDAGSRSADVRAAEARLAQQRASYVAAVRAAIAEVEKALVNLDSARQREADARAAVDGFAYYLTATEANWHAGGVSLLVLEEARRNANLAERKLVTLQRDRVQAWIALYKALGGGWTAHAGDPL